MPTNRRRRRVERRFTTTLDEDARYALEQGADYFGRFGTCDPGLDRAASLDRARACWEEHGRWLTAAWIEQQPGTRPWGWWIFEADEPRRDLGPDPIGGRLLESQADYLTRLQLWEPGERDRWEDMRERYGGDGPFPIDRDEPEYPGDEDGEGVLA